MFTMPLAPLTLNETTGDWMWTAASVLSLRSPTLAFDPSLPKDFDIPGGSDAVKNSGLSMLERYVARLLENTFEDSSLFWHYAMRHVPSASLACAKDYASTNYKTGTSMSFVNDAGIPAEDNISSYLPSDIPMHGYGAFPIGSIPTSCMCGWTKVASSASLSPFKCRIPAKVCTAIQISTPDCTYDPFTVSGKAVMNVILELWSKNSPQQEWECHDVDLSDSWGIVSHPEADNWIVSGASNPAGGLFPSRVSQLLRAGRSGMRMGNAKVLRSQARKEGVWPSARVHKLVPEDDPNSAGAAQRQCADTILNSIDAASVAREVVDDLFPVAQGIQESAPMSFCLRYAIEFSRLRMLRAIYSISPERDSAAAAAADKKAVGGQVSEQIRFQKSVTDLWRGRCESQLNMLGVCKSNGLFDLVPKKQFAYDCPFVISNPYSEGSAGYYVTPKGCLLYYKGSFYNPCRNPQKKCNSKSSSQKASFTLEEIVAASADTKIRFDVRDAGSGEVVGEWPIKFYDIDTSKNTVASQVVERLLRWKATSSSASTPEDAAFEAGGLAEDNVMRGANIPYRLSRRFIEEIFMQGGSHSNAKGSIGNTPVQSAGWGSAEGLVTDAKTADFCDGIADWWPDVSFFLARAKVVRCVYYARAKVVQCFYYARAKVVQCVYYARAKVVQCVYYVCTQDWTNPVGYHVTLPCSKDQAGYRTFDAAFAIDRGDGTIQMKYVHTALRDQDAYHSR